VPVGDVIPDYFPVVVKPDLFFQVQDTIKENIGKGGRNGVISNLFGTIAKCGYCGAPMRFENKGKWQYLVCDNALRGLECARVSLPYQAVERNLLNYVKGLNVKDLLPNAEESQSQLQTLQASLEARQGELSDLGRQIENVMSAVKEADKKSVRDRYSEEIALMLKEKEAKEKAKAEIERELRQLESANTDGERNLASLAELMAHMEKVRFDKRAELRFKLRKRLRDLIEKIDMYPPGIRGSLRSGLRGLLTYS